MYHARVDYSDGRTEFIPNVHEDNFEWLHEIIPAKTVYFHRTDGGTVLHGGGIRRIDVVRQAIDAQEVANDDPA